MGRYETSGVVAVSYRDLSDDGSYCLEGQNRDNRRATRTQAL